MLVGYTDELQTIPPKTIRECVKELRLPGEAGQHTFKEAARRLGSNIRRIPKAALWLSLAFLIVFFGYITASKFLGKPTGSLFGLTDRSQARSASGTAETMKPSPSSPSTDLSAQPKKETDSRQASKPTGQEEKVQGTGSPTDVKTSGTDIFPEGSKWVIPFGYDTNELPPETLAKLDELARQLLLKTDFNIVLKGYTDSIGGTEYNRSLSAFRANVVKSYLTGKGISSDPYKGCGNGRCGPSEAQHNPGRTRCEP